MNVAMRMTKNPITIHPETTVYDAQSLMRREKIHRLPVVSKDHKLLGIVTEKDLIYASPSPATTLDVYEMSYLLSKLRVEEVMCTNVLTVTEDTPVEEAARIMADNNIGGLPVLTAGRLVGIITESDLFKIFIEMLGARQKGLRMTMVIPEKKGELATLAAAIASRGGNILSLATFLGEDADHVILTVKVEDLTLKDLEAAVLPSVDRIIDVREL